MFSPQTCPFYFFLLFIAVYSLLCLSKVLELGQLSRVTFFSQADAKVELRKWSFYFNTSIDCDFVRLLLEREEKLEEGLASGVTIKVLLHVPPLLLEIPAAPTNG